MTLSFLFLAAFFFITAVVTKLCTDLYCKFAVRIGLLDIPDKNRKLQTTSIPVSGGIVVFLVTFFMCASALVLHKEYGLTLLTSRKILIPLLIATTLLTIVGIIDDRYGMSGKKKLAFQVLASTLVIFYAKDYSLISIFGQTFDLGHLFYPIGIFWLVGMINSVNLIDGADGVATTTGVLMSAAACIIAYINGHVGLMIVSLIFCASLCGFFWCNKPPARIYLGDTGSMLIGLVIGVLLLRACASEGRIIYVVPPLAVVMIPALDSVFAIIRRRNSRRNIFSPDRGHIHHRLQQKVGKGYKTLITLALLILPGCIAAVAGIATQNDWIPALVSLGVLMVAIGTGLFGREELLIILHRIFNRIIKRLKKSEYDKVGEVFHFQGKGPWPLLWADFVSSLKNCHCIKAHLDIHIPFLHEDYSSEWENLKLRGQSDIQLHCSVPLVCDTRKVGVLNIVFDTRRFPNIEALSLANDLGELCIKYINDYIERKTSSQPFQEVPSFQEIFFKEEVDVVFSRIDPAVQHERSILRK